MTREQAEANWVWHPKRGDIRPKEWPKNRRIHCTERNIEAQIALARPGTLIHTMTETDCPRKRVGFDIRRETYDEGRGMIEHSAVASFIENVNCLWCRRDYF